MRLKKRSCSSEFAQVTMKLAPRDRNNLDLQIDLARAYALSGKYELAEEEFNKLLRNATPERMGYLTYEDLLASAARNSARIPNKAEVTRQFDELLTLKPDPRWKPEDPPLPNDPKNPEFNETNQLQRFEIRKLGYRTELASNLDAWDQNKEVIDLLKNNPTDQNGKVLLVFAYKKAEDLKAANKVIDEMLAVNPQNPVALGLAGKYWWRRTGRKTPWRCSTRSPKRIQMTCAFQSS